MPDLIEPVLRKGGDALLKPHLLEGDREIKEEWVKLSLESDPLLKEDIILKAFQTYKLKYLKDFIAYVKSRVNSLSLKEKKRIFDLSLRSILSTFMNQPFIQ